ncbi:unnamed protein product [Boreogadus saida]
MTEAQCGNSHSSNSPPATTKQSQTQPPAAPADGQGKGERDDPEARSGQEPQETRRGREAGAAAIEGRERDAGADERQTRGQREPDPEAGPPPSPCPPPRHVTPPEGRERRRRPPRPRVSHETRRREGRDGEQPGRHKEGRGDEGAERSQQHRTPRDATRRQGGPRPIPDRDVCHLRRPDGAQQALGRGQTTSLLNLHRAPLSTAISRPDPAQPDPSHA